MSCLDFRPYWMRHWSGGSGALRVAQRSEAGATSFPAFFLLDPSATTAAQRSFELTVA